MKLAYFESKEKEVDDSETKKNVKYHVHPTQYISTNNALLKCCTRTDVIFVCEYGGTENMHGELTTVSQVRQEQVSCLPHLR
jgi:hypothetical protein